MKPTVLVVCLALFVGTVYGRLGQDDLRAALNTNPLFSHARGDPNPFRQNVNIRIPMSEVPQQETNVRPPSLPNSRPVALGAQTSGRGTPAQQNRPSGRGTPVQQNRPSGRGTPVHQNRPSGRGTPVQQNRRVTQVPAGKPVRQQEMLLGQTKPVKVAEQKPIRLPVQSQQRIVTPQPPTSQPPRNIPNDRMLSNVRPAANVASVELQVSASKQECSFQIPSFLLPDPDQSNIASAQSCPSFLLPELSVNPELVSLLVQHWSGVKRPNTSQVPGAKSQITQVEFEQKCLLPALRAHVLGGPACKTRDLKVYLEWLLDLRQRLFNI